MDGLSWQPIAPTRRHGASASVSFFNQQQQQQQQQQHSQPQQQQRASLSAPVGGAYRQHGAGAASSSAAAASATTAAYNAPHVQPKLTALPRPVLIRILSFVPLPDLPQAARTHSSIAAAFSDEDFWKARLECLAWAPVLFWDQKLAELVDSYSNATPSAAEQAATPTAATASVITAAQQSSNDDDDDDGFGDFEDASAPPASSSNGAAPKSFFDVDFTPKKHTTASGGTQVLFSSTPYRRVPAPDRHEAYRKVRAYTTLLQPLASYIREAIPDSFLQRRINASGGQREISLLGDDPTTSPGMGGDDDDEDSQRLPAELSPHLLWAHPSLPSPSSLTWNDQVGLLCNLVRFLSPTPAHHFQGLRSPPPAFAWKYEDGLWPWPSSPADAAELLTRLALGSGADAKSKRTSFAGIWRATDAVRHESRGYEAPHRRGSPSPGIISEEPSPNPENPSSKETSNPDVLLKEHLKRAHQLHIVAQVLLSHATALEQNVLLSVFEGASARKKDAERAAGLLGSATNMAPTSPVSPGPGATADAVKRAEDTMTSAARGAWALRRAFVVRDVLEESRDSSKFRSKNYDDEVPEELTQEQQLLGRAVAPGMLSRPPDAATLKQDNTGPNAASNTASPPSAANPSSSAIASAPPAEDAEIRLPPPKLTRATATELAALGYRLFQTYLSTLSILQRSSTLRRSHDPRSNIVAFSLPPLPSQASASYSTGADLDFGPMADAFIPALIDALRDSLSLVRRLFPASEGQDVDVQLLRRVVEVVLIGEYVDGLMAQIANLEKGSAKEAGLARWVEDVQGKPPLSLRALPAAFAQAMRLPSVFVPDFGTSIAPSNGTPVGKDGSPVLSPEQERVRLRAEDVIYLAFEPRMDAYLAHERNWVQRAMDRICSGWSNNAGDGLGFSSVGGEQLHRAGVGSNAKTDEAFLASANPAAAKKSLLTSFKDVLLVPVSVVPRTATFVGGAVVSTFAPRRRDPNEEMQGGLSVNSASGKLSPSPDIDSSSGSAVGGGGYMDFSKGGDGPFGIGDDEGEEEDETEDRNKEDGNNFGFGRFSGAQGSTAAGSSPFAAPEASEWASADHGVGPVSPTNTMGATSSSLSAAPTTDEGWGDFASSISSSSASVGQSTRPTSLATTVGRASVMSASAQQLAPPFSSPGGQGSGRSTPIPGKLGGGSGRSTPQPPGRTGTPVGKDGDRTALSRLQLLLSLDVALELIHLNRDTVKRVETFRGFPGAMGMRVRQEIEGIAVVFLQTLSDRHLTPGLKEATEQVKAWIPADHDPSSSSSSSKNKKKRNEAIANARMGRTTDGSNSDEAVEPLVHFFELVHVGDAIQQMVQVYFDQELSRHVDRTDFLNVVVREKKRFEGNLDECVAQGLNAGVDGLMGQVDYLMSTRQGPRDYYPEKPEHMDLGNPTEACQDVIRCLKTHCSMLVGSTDKSVLEVFYQEVGLRLYALICKHLKRQIISIDGGFKVIADLNAYHAFVASFLRQSQVITYFDALKMLGNIYIIDHPRELAQIVRDANMFGGMMSPEELYEFLQARSDFKSIEKAVDKEMYGFKVAEDCVIC
ncbi:F-box protein: endocytic membrane traffic, recycling ReCYcling 1 [Tilletia horrida]|nr:F-box protein: endocytic membrane traffic, recycling ReCYcling 1 [Tilletia horrida]